MADGPFNIEEHIRDIQEISIAIDSWDDIFSDFDPSPLDRRILSEDFLLELKKRYRETQSGNYVMTIYAPVSLKDEASERIVLKRLRQYFRLRHLGLQKEINEAMLKGVLFLIVGMVCLAVLTLTAYFKILSFLATELLGIVLMPLGWFCVWHGFSQILEPSPILKQDLELFSKFSRAAYKFKYAGLINLDVTGGGGI